MDKNDITKFRLSLKLTQPEFAKLLGLKPTTSNRWAYVSKLETGVQTVTSRIEQMCDLIKFIRRENPALLKKWFKKLGIKGGK